MQCKMLTVNLFLIQKSHVLDTVVPNFFLLAPSQDVAAAEQIVFSILVRIVGMPA